VEEAATDVNFIDVVNIDSEDALEGYIAEDLLGRLIESPPFKTLILITLILNTVTIALQTDPDILAKIDNILQVFDLIFVTIFVIEILLKWYHGFILYWRNGWNIFDFLVVVISLFSPLLPISGNAFRVLSFTKSFRLFRFWTVVSGVQIIVQVFIQALPDVANILMLLSIILLIFSIIGVTLFRDVLPDFFPTLQDSMFSMLIYLTQDGWASILEEFIAAEDYWLPSIFSILFVSLGPFILGNAFVGVIVHALENLIVKLSQTKKARHRKLQGEKLLKQETQNVKAAVRTDGVQNSTYKRQAPLAYTDFSKLTVQGFENYCLVLAAIEDNLAEFKNLKDTLEEILLEVKKMNSQQKEEDDEKILDDGSSIPGDVLSQMIRQADFNNKT